MASVVRKIVIGSGRRASKGDNGYSFYLQRIKQERETQALLHNLLVRWGRGFDLVDAPPAINEWTRQRPCAIMGPE